MGGPGGHRPGQPAPRQARAAAAPPPRALRHGARRPDGALDRQWRRLQHDGRARRWHHRSGGIGYRSGQHGAGASFSFFFTKYFLMIRGTKLKARVRVSDRNVRRATSSPITEMLAYYNLNVARGYLMCASMLMTKMSVPQHSRQARGP